MERLDTYDEFMNPVGTEDRDVVHEKGLWHKTVHCWLYDVDGNIYFQIRKDSGKLYTTASGHVLAGETIKEAFHREVLEEIGVSVATEDASMVEINVWKLDKIKNEKPFIDRAFANVYINKIKKGFKKFKFDENEVLGLVKVDAKDCLKLLNDEVDSVKAIKITNKTEKIELNYEDFLLFDGELAILKYGKILQAVIKSIN